MSGFGKRNKTNLSIMMIDIDNFKHINDTYGHAMGDKALLKTTSILKELTRKSDIICRWGGEEFIILFPQTNMSGAYQIAQKIKNAVENQNIPLKDDQHISFTISIGLTEMHPTNDTNLELAINRADKALYTAKDAGKNTICQELS